MRGGVGHEHKFLSLLEGLLGLRLKSTPEGPLYPCPDL